MSDSLRHHRLQHLRSLCPSLFPSVCPSSCPLNQRFYPTLSSSVIPFSSCLQPFPASRSFPMSQLFASGSQRIRASALTSVLPMSVQGWFPLGVTGLISWRKTCKAQRTWGRPQRRNGDEVNLIQTEEGRRKREINEEQLISWRWCPAWKKIIGNTYASSKVQKIKMMCILDLDWMVNNCKCYFLEWTQTYITEYNVKSADIFQVTEESLLFEIISEYEVMDCEQ